MSRSDTKRRRVAVIGHVEHITLGRVPSVPGAGDIAHLEGPMWFPGGGGGITFFQLVNGPDEVHLFTAIGNDEAGQQVRARIDSTGAIVHAASRDTPHTRDLVMIDAQGERTIVVVGEPLHPRADDPLPWGSLADIDAVYFTAQDPQVLRLARKAPLLMATARRQRAIRESGVRLDAIVGSNADPRERSTLADYSPAPGAVIMTEGDRGGVVETSTGRERFSASLVEDMRGGAYGAGDSFAGALLHFLAHGLPAREAAQRAGPFGAAVFGDLNPLAAQATLPGRDRTP